jgi:hypothetical protein
MIVIIASPGGDNMGLLDKAKDVTKKTVDVGKKAGRKGIDLGKKGVDKTKDAVRKKTCSECKHYTPIDEDEGDCPIAGKRLASADNATCPQKAFEPK